MQNPQITTYPCKGRDRVRSERDRVMHSVLDINGGLASGGVTPCSFPHSFPSSSPTFTLEPLHKFRWLTGVRGVAVVRVVAANQAGNDELERGVREAFLGFRHDSRFFGSSIAFLRSVSSVLDTLTPLFELYVRLREKRQELRPESREVPSMGLQLVAAARYDVPCYGTGLLVVSVLVPCGNRVGYGSVLVFSVLDINSGLASRFSVSQARVLVMLRVLSRYLCCAVKARVPRGARHGPAACGCRCGVGWSPQLFDFFLVERQLELSSVTVRLRGSSCVVLFGLDTGLISQ
ncbi:hypothetical protein Taro_055188 [Colocasia esculenta]|uniref:Uncharacterized protein n=1 Tax=Colocasia esculenta TaxID=4460 RepID=A0A843XSV9_COLES|nr:hypothetical protein [Colocasia esculenta]